MATLFDLLLVSLCLLLLRDLLTDSLPPPPLLLHLLYSTSPPPLQCDFQLSSTARSKTTHLRRIRTQAKWSPVSEFTITGRLSSIARSVNWSEVVPPLFC